MITDIICFAIGFVLACGIIAALYVRARRNSESILSVIHGDLAGALGRIEAKIDGGAIPK